MQRAERRIAIGHHRYASLRGINTRMLIPATAQKAGSRRALAAHKHQLFEDELARASTDITHRMPVMIAFADGCWFGLEAPIARELDSTSPQFIDSSKFSPHADDVIFLRQAMAGATLRPLTSRDRLI